VNFMAVILKQCLALRASVYFGEVSMRAGAFLRLAPVFWTSNPSSW